MTTDQPTGDLCDCGWVRDTFPCKIRHLHLNTGEAKAAND